MLSVTATGLKEALAFLKNLGAACQVVARSKKLVTSEKPYLHWVNEGFYKGGRRGKRRGGGAKMLQKGASAAAQIAPGVITAGLVKGPSGAAQAMQKVEDKALEVTQLHTPERSGQLKGSMHGLRGG